MYFFQNTLILFLFISTGVLGDVSSSFEEYEITPTYIQKAPENNVSVVYSKGVTAQLGNELRVQQTDHEPEISFDVDDPESLYTLIMFDPDAPVPQTALHWLVVDIKGDDLRSGHHVAPYMQPANTPGQDPHRYIQVICKQQGTMHQKSEYFAKESARVMFDVKKFIDDNNLVPLCGNFFLGLSVSDSLL